MSKLRMGSKITNHPYNFCRVGFVHLPSASFSSALSRRGHPLRIVEGASERIVPQYIGSFSDIPHVFEHLHLGRRLEVQFVKAKR